MFFVHTKTKKPLFSNSSDLRSVFEKFGLDGRDNRGNKGRVSKFLRHCPRVYRMLPQSVTLKHNLVLKLIGGGSKSWRKKPENSINVVPQQWRDLQQALEKERASSLKLQTEVNRIRQEMQAAKMEGIANT